jgi:ABC-2 type transport system permease protein
MSLSERATGRLGPVAARVELGRICVGYGFLEVQRTYTFAGYFISWMLRVAGQVLFYGILGRAIAGAAGAQYLVIGTAVGLILLETLLVVLTTVLDRNLGTLVMLAATPSAPADVFITRGLQWVLSAVVSATLALLLMPPMLGVALPWTTTLEAMPVLVCIALACSAYSATLSCVVLRAPSATWLVINFGYLFVIAFVGVAVPVAYWPAWLQAATEVLPIRHGLSAIRQLYEGGGLADVAGEAAAELGVAVLWLLFARLAYHVVIGRMRRRGLLDLPS